LGNHPCRSVFTCGDAGHRPRHGGRDAYSGAEMTRDPAIVAANIIASGLEIVAAVLFFGAIAIFWVIT